VTDAMRIAIPNKIWRQKKKEIVLGCRGVKLGFNNRFLQTLRIIGPSNGGVRVLKTAPFRECAFHIDMWKVGRRSACRQLVGP